MKIGSISENLNSEKRISITPEVANKYINLGLEVCLNSNYGSHLGFDDKKYKELKLTGCQKYNAIIEVITIPTKEE